MLNKYLFNAAGLRIRAICIGGLREFGKMGQTLLAGMVVFGEWSIGKTS